MTPIFLVLTLSAFVCSASDLPFVFYSDHVSGGSEVHGDVIFGPESTNAEYVHPTTCLLCCKFKSGKYNATLCKNLNLCNSKTCVKYLDKKRGSPLLDANIISALRRGRTREVLVPEQRAPEICNQLHPEFRNVRIQPIASYPCSFFCVSEHKPLLANHKTPNGWGCDENKKVCWDGVCQKRAGLEDHEFCRKRVHTSVLIGDAGVEAVLKLPCYVVCKATSTGMVWYVPRTDNDSCNAPEWLPRDMGLDMENR